MVLVGFFILEIRGKVKVRQRQRLLGKASTDLRSLIQGGRSLDWPKFIIRALGSWAGKKSLSLSHILPFLAVHVVYARNSVFVGLRP